MENKIDENKKGIERGPVGYLNREESLENVIGNNREKETETMGKIAEMDSEIEERISEAFGGGPSPEKKEVIDKEKEIFERAKEVVREYDETVGKITKNGSDIEVETNEDLGNNERKREISDEEIEATIGEYLNNKKGVDEKEKKDFGDFIINEKIDKLKNTPITRRDFLKGLVGVAIALISKDYLLDNINAWWSEYQEKKEIYKERTSLIEMSDNPKSINLIDRKKSVNSPLEIGSKYYSKPIFHDGFMLKGSPHGKTYGIDFSGMYYGDPVKNREIYDKLMTDLNKLGFTDNHQIDFAEFEKNIDNIAEVISINVGIPKEIILAHLQETINADTDNISITKYENWEVNMDLSFKSALLDKNKAVEENYSKASSISEKDKILEEYVKWGKENGYEDVYVAKTKEENTFCPSLRDAIPEDKTTSIGNMREIVSEEVLTEENNEFKNILMQKLEEEGYSVYKLKEIAEKDPKEIINIISYIISKNVKYDAEKYELQKTEKYDQLKRQAPYHTLKYGKGVCMDYAELFCRIKDHLEGIGVPNLDKFISLFSSDGAPELDHAWVNLVTVDKNNKLIVTAIDPTWADRKENESKEEVMIHLNAVDEEHYYPNREKNE